MSLIDGVIGEDKNLVIQRLLEKLSLSTEREERYRKVMKDYIAGKVGLIDMEEALSSPAPPSTRGRSVSHD